MPSDPPPDVFFRPVSRSPSVGEATPIVWPLPPTRPLVPRKPSPPLCDTHLILDRYYNRPSLTRASSQALPLDDCVIPREAFVDYSFIDFGPTYTVTVSELRPHQLALRKPRPARFSARIASYFKEPFDGKV